MHDGQAEPRTARAGREKRVERAFADLWLHAVAVIFDLDRYGGAARQLAARHDDVHTATAAHRLTRVLHQVVEDQTEQARVDPDRLDFRVRVDGNHYVVTIHRLRTRAIRELYHRNGGSLHVHRPREAKQIGHQAVQASGLFVHDREEHGAVLLTTARAPEACDRVDVDGQRISDFMCDRSGKLTDRRELILGDELTLHDAQLRVRAAQFIRAALEPHRGLLQAAGGQPIAHQYRTRDAERENQEGMRKQADRVAKDAGSQAHVVDHGGHGQADANQRGQRITTTRTVRGEQDRDRGQRLEQADEIKCVADERRVPDVVLDALPEYVRRNEPKPALLPEQSSPVGDEEKRGQKV